MSTVTTESMSTPNAHTDRQNHRTDEQLGRSQNAAYLAALERLMRMDERAYRFDVRLSARDEKDEDVETVVQPDLVVACDLSKLDDRVAMIGGMRRSRIRP